MTEEDVLKKPIEVLINDIRQLRSENDAKAAIDKASHDYFAKKAKK